MPRPSLVGPHEPVTLSDAANLTGRSRDVLRELVRDGLVKPKACIVRTRAQVFELWEIEAALDCRRPYRRVATSDDPAIPLP